MMSRAKKIFQFRVSLLDIEPQIWRRIQVPSTYSFWDLHVALQDSMGWLDCHLHMFHFSDSKFGEELDIGIPDLDVPEDDWQCLPGWEIPIDEYFAQPGDDTLYVYDFGDSWRHQLTLEEVIDRAPRKRYPKCVGGERACPPEDCGGPMGHMDLIRILRVPSDEEHADMLEWLGGKFDPEAFDPTKVTFADPQKRWEVAFAGDPVL
jgi:hypothetical protein